MITIGLTTFSEHRQFFNEPERKLTLTEYAQFLPCVELDTAFYGIPRASTVLNWLRAVPETFQFIIKANQVMTQHQTLVQAGLDSVAPVFEHFRQTFAPMQQAGQLKTVLMQFPPYFGVSAENVAYLKLVRHYLPKWPVAVEFRNPTWYQAQYRASTLKLLAACQFTHVIVDVPQTPAASVPYYPVATNDHLAMFRLHGRNYAGWANQAKDWRKRRTLYRYSRNELQALIPDIQRLAATTRDVCIIFNNNSGGDAAGNALQLKQLLGLEFNGLAPQQIGLF
jgi:uncharacterized protein YecE (DUF72 family)